jgi:hypothetical protein
MADEKTAPQSITGALPPLPQTGLIQVQCLVNPNRPIIYANNSLIIGTQWDIQMYFSLVHEIAPTQFGAVEEAMIVMTPEHAMALLKALKENLEKYEAAQGKIRDIKIIQIPQAAAHPAAPPEAGKKKRPSISIRPTHF